MLLAVWPTHVHVYIEHCPILFTGSEPGNRQADCHVATDAHARDAGRHCGCRRGFPAVESRHSKGACSSPQKARGDFRPLAGTEH